MPAEWIYFLAVLLLLVLRILVVDLDYSTEWLWYNGHEQLYYTLMNLRSNEIFLSYAGGWALPVFVVSVCIHWMADNEYKDIGKQFLLLPIVFAPFFIAGQVLTKEFTGISELYTRPLVLIPLGYLYIFPWVLFVWVFRKLRLLVD